MTLINRARLFGILLIAASLPMDPGLALTATAASAALEGNLPSGSVEARMQRIALAIQQQAVSNSSDDPDAANAVMLDPSALSWWGNGGFRNGGFRDGGFWNGGFRNGGFWNGGFGNGGFRNGGFRNVSFLNF